MHVLHHPSVWNPNKGDIKQSATLARLNETLVVLSHEDFGVINSVLSIIPDSDIEQ